MNTEKFSGTLLKVAKKQEKVDILINKPVGGIKKPPEN